MTATGLGLCKSSLPLIFKIFTFFWRPIEHPLLYLSCHTIYQIKGLLAFFPTTKNEVVTTFSFWVTDKRKLAVFPTQARFETWFWDNQAFMKSYIFLQVKKSVPYCLYQPIYHLKAVLFCFSTHKKVCCWHFYNLSIWP